jgi:hypothetical protein
MLRTTLIVSAWLGAGCSVVPREEEPRIPADFPQLDAFDLGKAHLVVDGTGVTISGHLTYDESGVDEDRLRASGVFDHLWLDFRDVAEDEYTVASGELEASWSETADYEAGDACGSGSVSIMGHNEAGSLIAQAVVWGTVQLDLCEADYGGPVAGGEMLEVSGRFSAVLYVGL